MRIEKTPLLEIALNGWLYRAELASSWKAAHLCVTRSTALQCRLLISWQFKMYFLPMILFANSIPFFPQIELHTMYSLSRKGCTLPDPTNSLFSIIADTFPATSSPSDYFQWQILANHQMQTSLGVIVSIVVVIKNFWPAVGSISDGSTALRHWASFRSSGR